MNYDSNNESEIFSSHISIIAIKWRKSLFLLIALSENNKN